jgi:hypothetical protein
LLFHQQAVLDQVLLILHMKPQTGQTAFAKMSIGFGTVEGIMPVLMTQVTYDNFKVKQRAGEVAQTYR